jgi:hypothetical protein
MRRTWHATLLALVLAAWLVAPAGPVTATTGNGGTTPRDFDEPAVFQTGDVEADSVLLRVAVDEDGDARWRIEYRVRLTDENRTAAFESLRRDVEANESRYRDQFAGRMARTVATAENATGREMAVRNVSVTATTQQLGRSYGVVAYRFEWTGFAAVDGDRLRIGDAIAGFFIDSGTRLTIAWPEGYEARTVRPPADDRTETSVAWTGPTDFGSDQPGVVVAPSGAGLPPLTPVAVAVVVLAAGAGGLWWHRRGADDRPGDATGEGTAARAAGSARADAAADGETGDEEAAGDADGEEPPLELLSPAERVLHIVEANGGRVKQQQVVSELDWSAARTSQVVGDLREEGRVETFRLGRENVIRLPEADDAPDDPGDGDEAETR